MCIQSIRYAQRVLKIGKPITFWPKDPCGVWALWPKNIWVGLLDIKLLKGSHYRLPCRMGEILVLKPSAACAKADSWAGIWGPGLGSQGGCSCGTTCTSCPVWCALKTGNSEFSEMPIITSIQLWCNEYIYLLYLPLKICEQMSQGVIFL